jgi:glycosyltransferase involved in cell wall biosynthesis
MRNILYVNHASQLAGAEHSLLLLLEHIDRARFNPTVAVPQTGPLTEALDAIGVPWRVARMARLKRTRNPIRLCSYFAMWRRASSQIERLIGELGIDLVHANATTSHLFAFPAAKRVRVPCIWHVRDVRSPGGWLGQKMTQNASAIIAVSEAAKGGLRWPELAASKTCVIHNGVDTTKFKPGDRTALRTELGLTGSAPLAGIVGQIVPWKGHGHFLAACAIAAKELPDARFLIVGDDRFGDHPGLLDDLKDEARSLGLGDRVMFLGWRDDAVAVMNALDVLVVSSETEPFGRVVIEAMACGKPVVSFRCGGPAEIITHEKSGLLVTPHDAAEMAAGIVRVLSGPADAAEMGRLGRETVCERFDAESHAANVQNIYARLLD